MNKLEKKNILLLGGARSGKSDYAQRLADLPGKKVLFCATAEALDDDMMERISRHRALRPPGWDTIEAPLKVADTIGPRLTGCDTLILDCITLLVSNCLAHTPDIKKAEKSALDEISSLITLMSGKQCDFIIVTNEVGSGIVPANPLGRIYRDTLGRANQMLAAAADEVYMLFAGIPVKIK
jgi:adenosylcobinamide kinase/adenosylcobinamide-phosphate guanylyltransferase